MGEFGALHVVLKYPKNWGQEKVFGSPVSNANFWNEKAIINNAHQFIYLHILGFIAFGVDDFSWTKKNRQRSGG